MKQHSKLLAGGLLALALSLSAPAQNFWQGGSSLNWSDANNWTAGAPAPFDMVFFEDVFTTGYTNAPGLVNNIVDGNFSPAMLLYTALSSAGAGGVTNHFHTTLIPAGATLTLGGFGFAQPALAVGDVPGFGAWLNAGTWTNYSTILGAGSLVVNDAGGLVSVAMRNRATLDLTGLNDFSANAQQILVGASPDNPNSTGPTGWLLLGATNTVTTVPNAAAPGVLVASANAGNSGGFLGLGGVNTFHTDGLTVGGRRASGAMLAFGPAYSNASPASTFTLRGSAGGASRTPTFSIGDLAARPESYLGSPAGSSTATADFTGGVVDIRADDIFVGRSAADTGSGGGFTYGFGTLILERGMVDANRLNIGYKQGTNLSSSLNGSSGVVPCVVTLKSNVAVTVNQDVSMAFRNNGTNGSQMPAGALQVNDTATIAIGGDITSPTNGLAILQLGGGTVNMTGGGDITVTTLAGSGTVAGADVITVRSNVIPGGVTTPGALNLGGSLVIASGFPITFNLGANSTPGGGINDYVNVSGSVTFNNNPLLLTFAGPLLSGSTYHLIDFGGTRAGLLAFTNATRSDVVLDQTTPGHVDLVVNNWSPGTLKWAGNANNLPAGNVWNAGDTNWSNGGAPDRFFQMDHVVFDDTALSTVIWPQGALYPASITIEGTKNFWLTNRSTVGPPYVGSINGACSITKNGTGTFLLGCYSNTFTGPIFLNDGILKPFDPTFTTPGNNMVLGSPAAILYVTNTGTFDIGGIGSISPGKQIHLKGTGFNGQGAITNSVSNTGATLNGYHLTLVGDTTVAAGVGGWGLRGLATSGAFYSGLLNLNGFTLTKVGTARFTLQDVLATSPGSINFDGGHLSLQNSVLSGPGTITFADGTYLMFPFAAGATSYVAKAIVTAGNFGLLTPASGNAVGQVLMDSPLTLGGPLFVTNNQTLILGGVLSGPASAGLFKYGNSNLVLNAANSYAGPTLITAGTLTLGPGGSLQTSPLLTINPGARLDVAPTAGAFATVPGQTLVQNGTAVGDVTIGAGSTLLGAGIFAGSLTVANGAEVAPTTTNVVGMIVVSNKLSLQGAHLTWELAPSFDLSDGFVVGGDLELSGVNTFTVSSIGGFDPSGTNTLITCAGNLTGGLANLAVNSSARFLVELVDPALTPGKIQIRLVTPSPLLTWKGGTPGKPTIWDIQTTPNWDNAGSPDVFWSSDLVRFDDTATTTLVDLVGILGPASIVMENYAAAYTFRGTGGLVSASLTNNGVGLTVSNTANNFLTGAGLALNSGNTTFAQPTNATLRANLMGYGTLTKAGNSNLTVIGSAEHFAGAVNLNAGTLTAGSSNVLGAGFVTVAPGATLDVNGQFLQAAAALTISGPGADGQGAINNRGAGRTNAVANVILAGDTTLGAASNAWGIVSSLTGNRYKLVKTNANDVWIMTGNDTDLGAVEIRQGRLVFSGAGTTLGTKADSLTVWPNATLAFATTNAMPQSGTPPPPFDGGQKAVVLQNNAALESIGFGVNQTSSNTYRGAITISSNAIFRVGGNSVLTLGGPISGANGQVIVTNGGTLLLSGINSYTSNTLVYSGTLVLPTVTALPTNTSLYISNRVTTGNPALTLAGDVEMPADRKLFISTLNSAASVGGDGAWLGPISITGGNALSLFGGESGLRLLGAISQPAGSGSVSIEGSNLRIAGSLRVTNSLSIGVSSGLGAGFGQRFTTVRFDGENNFWTNVTWGRGRIILGSHNALPPNAPMRLGVLSAGVGDRRLFLDLNGFNQTVTSISETAVGDSLIRFGNNSADAHSILTFAGLPNVTNTWAIRLQDVLDSPWGDKTLGLTVASGRLALVSTNTYTGPTLVSGGTLLLNQGSGLTAGQVGQLGFTPVLVHGAGTLGGSGGIVYGPVAVGAGGTLSPGLSVGTLDLLDALTLQTGGRCVMEVNNLTATNDLVRVGGLLTCGGSLVISNLGGAYQNGQVIKLFDAGAYAGAFSQILFPGVVAYDATRLTVDGTIKVLTALSTAPAPLSFSLTGGNTLQLSWPYDHTGWRLETQTNAPGLGLGTNWVTVPGSTEVNTMSFPIDPAHGSVFFRLLYP